MDIISLNETNLNDEISTDSLNVPINCTFKRLDRGIGSRGGCGMIISDKVSYRPINLKTNLSNIEANWIKLNESSIYIWGFYRSSGFCKLDNFLDYFCECMNKLKGKKVFG